MQARAWGRRIDSSMDQSNGHTLYKVYYTPIEAAIRWARLWREERRILDVLQTRSIVEHDDFPEWPGLRLASERIFDALHNSELPYRICGEPAPPGTSVVHPNLTIRHVELKSWMMRYYPEHRPKFLFGVLERCFHPAITMSGVRELALERDTLKSLVAEREIEISALRLEVAALLKSIDANARRVSSSTDSLSKRAETVYLNIIAGQLDLLHGQEPTSKAAPLFRTQEEIISALIDRYSRRLGITKSTLESKFAAANRLLANR
jgi:hypothetical protein